MTPIRRPLSFVPDAAWIRRQFTRDADAAHDAAHAVRLLLKTPGFTAIALLVFAIGIGGATAMVSLADALYVRPLPVPQADRVMTVWQHNRETGLERQDVTPANGLDWMARTRAFEAIASVEGWALSTTRPSQDADLIPAAIASEQFFPLLGVAMLHGRPFLPEEHRRGAGRFAILDYGFWRDRFGGDPAIVGQAVRLQNEDRYTIVGILPRGFELRLFNYGDRRPPEPYVWLPKQGVEESERTNRTTAYWNIIGRLRAGVSRAQAQAELDTISAQLAAEHPQTNRPIVAQLLPLRSNLAGGLRGVLPLLIGVATILLLVACANIANLLLARGAARAREFAVRQALGAGRLRLIRQMLVESLLLATMGGVLGLGVARLTLEGIARLRSRSDFALIDQITIDARAAIIACAVTLVAAIVAGLAPSLQLSRPAASTALRETRSVTRRGGRSLLVIAEVAAALLLTVGAGLLVRSFVLIQGVDPGFTRDQVTILQVFASRRIDTPAKRQVFFQQALDRLRTLPGVVAAGGVSAMPFAEAKMLTRVPLTVAGRPPATGDAALVTASTVDGDYFRALGVTLVKGRLFDATDTSSSRQVALVSRTAARQFWPDGDPVGSQIRFRFYGISYDAEVVGVVGEVRHEALDQPAAAEVYVPYAQCGSPGFTLVVRTDPRSPVTLDALKQQIWALDPLQTIFSASSLEALIDRTLVVRRFNLFLLGGFALATLLLACAGIYGVTSFSTGQRTREFGVRLALGATPRDIVGLVLREGLTLTGAGVLAGLVLALPLTGLLRALLFGVTATDPATFLLVSLVLVLVAAAACYVPARRALSVDPMTSLRLD